MTLPAMAAAPAPAVPMARRAGSVLHALWDQMAMYLPLVLMGLLALLTYWMVQIAPQLVEPEEARPPVHEVDFFMRGATIKTYDKAGRLQNELSGTEMRHYADNATVEVDQARWRSVAPDGRVTRASARQALGKDDGSELQLIGQAVVVREPFTQPDGKVIPRVEYRGEFLHIFANDERLQSHLPVVVLNGQDEFTGDRFTYDHVNRVVELQGRVTARIEPRSSPARR